MAIATLTVDDSVKMLRETFCQAQQLVLASSDFRAREHADRLQRLIVECDRHRPLGADGKHGNLHTNTCGCEDKGRTPVGN
jgi:hypothetical protein